MTLQELADRLGCRLEGAASSAITGVAGLDEAGPGDVTFLANPAYAPRVAATRAGAIIAGDALPAAPCAILRSSNPYLAFARAVACFAPADPAPAGIHATAIVASGASLGEGVSVGPFTIIESGARIGARTRIGSHATIGTGAVIGADCRLGAHVSVMARVSLGDRVVVQDSSIVGSAGFGYAPRGDGTYEPIVQAGAVVIEDDVEIGALTAIDRPAVGETRISAGTKIDNLVQIAHGVRVGRNVLLAAQVGIAGSTVIEDNVALGGQVGVTGHVTVGAGVQAAAKTGVTGDIKAGTVIAGYPSDEIQSWRKSHAALRRMPQLRERIRQLEETVEELLARLQTPGSGPRA
ncbi:MAG: UDP-3-O-(3-hydroxymyristoyl)glucosamine N-acyltransferase [Acidobacteriota bacterium]|nr:UDP-3-O-(3-hydroxymyristoyl)glucosamine N-acyltransferase [Acidobacteriota bacterium]